MSFSYCKIKHDKAGIDLPALCVILVYNSAQNIFFETTVFLPGQTYLRRFSRVCFPVLN